MEFHPIKNIATHDLFSHELPNNIAEILRDHGLDNELYDQCMDGDFSFKTSYNKLLEILTKLDDEYIAEEIEAGWTEEDDPLETYVKELELAFPLEWKNDNHFMLWFIH